MKFLIVPTSSADVDVAAAADETIRAEILLGEGGEFSTLGMREDTNPVVLDSK